jgi:aminopeptidase YwaD
LACVAFIAICPAALAHPPPLLPQSTVAALANELSGEIAKHNLEGLVQFHRQRGSRGFHAAAMLIAERARSYGLSEVQIMEFPADGETFYGTQRARRAWDATQAELTEVSKGRGSKIASYAEDPVVLAEDSESADVTAELVDVGAGTEENDYAGKEVAGKIILAAAQPGAVQEIAIARHGAVGVISYAQNQRTAWSGDNDNLIRWGHLESFSSAKTFAFMVSLRTARAMQQRLAAGEPIQLHAQVTAGQHPGVYEVVTATIPGGDPRLAAEEIAFSCHLDHQRPGANDNASGCVTILEVARTLQKLIADGSLARPARTIRFIWPPEIEGTITLLNARPEFAQRIKAAVHMDMVGGGMETKAVFHVTRGPMSLPSFVHDVAWAFAAWINQESYEFAAGGSAEYPLTAPEGGKEPLRADYSAYTMGSDHDVYQDSSFKIPTIYLNDWPDRYIHTNCDTAANIDTTKLKRAALIGAGSGYFLANLSAHDTQAATRAIALGKLLRAATALERGTAAQPLAAYENAVLASLAAFNSLSGVHPAATSRVAATQTLHRAAQPRGPLTVFGYDYFLEHAKAAGLGPVKLLDFQGAWGGGEEYAYEALNFADGHRSVRQIADEVSAEYGPVSPQLVAEYLEALKKIGILE